MSVKGMSCDDQSAQADSETGGIGYAGHHNRNQKTNVWSAYCAALYVSHCETHNEVVDHLVPTDFGLFYTVYREKSYS